MILARLPYRRELLSCRILIQRNLDNQAAQAALQFSKISAEALLDLPLDADGNAPYLLTEAQVKLAVGAAKIQIYGGEAGFPTSKAILIGAVENSQNAVLLRLHSECFTGDILNSRHCDCRHQLTHALEMIAGAGAGLVLYLPQEGRSIGLANKLDAYRLQQTKNLDTVDANLALGLDVDNRDFSFAIEILKKLGISKSQTDKREPDEKESLASRRD